MRNFIILILAGLIITSCEKDSLSSADRNTYSEDGSISFEELLILLNVKSSENSYLVASSIDSINIYINNYYWTKINSQKVDTTKVDKFVNGNMFLSNKKLNYLVIANQDIEQPDYNIAGDFAKYLNNFATVKPGEYACFIESFQVTFNDNTVKKYYPMEYKTFKVEQNLRSAYVGEIELTIE